MEMPQQQQQQQGEKQAHGVLAKHAPLRVMACLLDSSQSSIQAMLYVCLPPSSCVYVHLLDKGARCRQTSMFSFLIMMIVMNSQLVNDDEKEQPACEGWCPIHSQTLLSMASVFRACVCIPFPTMQAALGVNTSLFSLSFVVFNFLATATAPMVAAAVSARETRQAGETVWQAAGMALVLGLAVELLLLTNSGPLLALMGVDASQTAVLPLASEYLAWR